MCRNYVGETFLIAPCRRIKCKERWPDISPATDKFT
jgi:hypothetical protein